MSKELPVFSPSFTRAFDFCAVKAAAERKEGLTVAVADKALLSRIAGSAFHAGAAILHRAMRDATNEVPYPFCSFLNGLQDARIAIMSHVEEAALSVYKAMFTAYVEAGGAVLDSEYQLGMDRTMLALKSYASKSPCLFWKAITGVEKQFPEAGRCVLDISGQGNEGIPVVADIKFSLFLDSYAYTRRLTSYAFDWSLQHYAWAEYPNQECEAQIILVVASPSFKVLIRTWHITPKSTALWLRSAEQKWGRMADSIGKAPIELEQAATHADMYGPCILKQWCQDMRMEGTLPTELIRVKWPRMMDVEQ